MSISLARSVLRMLHLVTRMLGLYSPPRPWCALPKCIELINEGIAEFVE